SLQRAAHHLLGGGTDVRPFRQVGANAQPHLADAVLDHTDSGTSSTTVPSATTSPSTSAVNRVAGGAAGGAGVGCGGAAGGVGVGCGRAADGLASRVNTEAIISGTPTVRCEAICGFRSSSGRARSPTNRIPLPIGICRHGIWSAGTPGAASALMQHSLEKKRD